MEPLTAATSFATIVGLLSNFKSERSGTQLSDFMEWLKDKRHEDVAQSIEQNQMLSIQLKSLLALNHQELVKRLDSLDSVLASVASHIEAFSSLATAVRSDSLLSDQVMSIVRQFVDSGAKEMWERKHLGGTDYLFIDGSGHLEIHEPRFIEDDLNALLELGIFRLDFGGKGTRKFIITRQALQLASSRDR